LIENCGESGGIGSLIAAQKGKFVGVREKEVFLPNKSSEFQHRKYESQPYA
jgi:hypothetical protein